MRGSGSDEHQVSNARPDEMRIGTISVGFIIVCFKRWKKDGEGKEEREVSDSRREAAARIGRLFFFFFFFPPMSHFQLHDRSIHWYVPALDRPRCRTVSSVQAAQAQVRTSTFSFFSRGKQAPVYSPLPFEPQFIKTISMAVL